MSYKSNVKHWSTKLLFQFLQESRPYWLRLNCIAVSSNESEAFVWIELNEEDDQLEDQLTMLEASVNARYHYLGYDLDMMIVEAEAQIAIPDQYSLIPMDQPLDIEHLFL